MFTSTVRCYDCNEQVASLKEHRKDCSVKKFKKTIDRYDRDNRKFNKALENNNKSDRTVECYDCHEQVQDLKTHRLNCTKSRKAKSEMKVNSDSKSDSKFEDATTMFMLLDVSASMSGSRLDSGKKGIQECFDLMKDTDRFSICTFDTEAFFKLKPRSVEQLKRQKEIPDILNRIFAKGCTALYDAIILTVSQIHDKTGKNIVTVLTDGEDNSSKSKLEDVNKLMKEYPNIEIHIIHVGDSKNVDFESIVKDKGTYQLIKEVDITITITTTFKSVYIK
jgi:uncharacterized protein YegL